MAHQYGMGDAVLDYHESDILRPGNVDFFAGLKQVPLTYYEAAEIDGASEWDKFIKITVPMVIAGCPSKYRNGADFSLSDIQPAVYYDGWRSDEGDLYLWDADL